MSSTRLHGLCRASSWDFRILSQPSRQAPGEPGSAGGARLHGRGADNIVAQLAEQLAEAGDLFFIDLGEGLRRDVAPREAGAAGGDDDVDIRIRDPGA